MKMRVSRKGISPLIATVLLIAFTITIATLLASWMTGFTTTQTETTGTTADAEIKCAYGSITIKSMKYNNSDTKLYAEIENNAGDVDLSNITFSIILANSSTYTYSTTCNCNDETLRAAETKIYSNSSVVGGCNIDKVYVTSNCRNAYDVINSNKIDFYNC